MKIDFHNHYYPPEYLAAVKQGPAKVRIDYDAEGNPRLHYPGDYNILVPGHRDLDYREGVLQKHGVDKQVITFTTPGTHFEEPETAVEMAKHINNAFAAAVKERQHFLSLATLPLNDPAASVTELERAMTTLGLPGAMVFSNVNGVALADAVYEPLWKKANELGAVIYIHPAHPLGVEAMEKFWLMPLVGFPMDTTLAAAHLVFAGVPERYPNIKWVLCHMGGAVPYLAERFDRGYEAFEECRANISRAPSTYEEVLLRHGEFRSELHRAGDQVRRRRSHPGRQRLPAPNRQHPEDAGCGQPAAGLIGGTRRHRRPQRRHVIGCELVVLGTL